jgi:hypothetical protein
MFNTCMIPSVNNDILLLTWDTILVLFFLYFSAQKCLGTWTGGIVTELRVGQQRNCVSNAGTDNRFLSSTIKHYIGLDAYVFSEYWRPYPRRSRGRGLNQSPLSNVEFKYSAIQRFHYLRMFPYRAQGRFDSTLRPDLYCRYTQFPIEKV